MGIVLATVELANAVYCSLGNLFPLFADEDTPI